MTSRLGSPVARRLLLGEPGLYLNFLPTISIWVVILTLEAARLIITIYLFIKKLIPMA